MADNSIDLVVSKQAFDQLEKLLLKIKEADSAIEALNVNAGKNPTTPSGGETNAAENAKIIAQMKELTAEINKQAEAATKLVAARVKNTNAVTQDAVNARIERANRVADLKLDSDKLTQYQKLEAAQKKAANEAKEEAAQIANLIKVKGTAAERAKQLGLELQRIDASVGKYNRNVGNYASGWNGLANSVNQLTREAPAFANSLNTGFMALSNNIPILADEINNLI
jgi:chromosome segregation ATPase